MVGKSIVGAQVDGLLISSECLLIALEVIEGIALVVVGSSKVGVQVDGLLKGGQRFLGAHEVIEGIALVVVGQSKVRIQADGVVPSSNHCCADFRSAAMNIATSA